MGNKPKLQPFAGSGPHLQFSSPTISHEGIGISQFLVILLVAVTLILAWDFGRRLIETVRLIRTAHQVERQLRQVEQVHAQLSQLKKDILTDAWVEKKARRDLHYARDNETLFVPIATPLATRSMPAPLVPPPTPTRSLSQDWLEGLLEWLFGPAR